MTCTAILISSNAFAQRYGGGGGGSEGVNLLSIGAGISSPSVTSAIGENPAGLIANQTTKLLVSGFSENSSFDPLGLGGTMYFGNGTVGAGLGYQKVTDGGGSAMVFGLAGEITAMNLAFGAAGSYQLSDGFADRLGLDLGLQFNARGPLKFGATAFNVNGGVNSYGAGVSYDANPSARLVIDASVNDDFEGLRLKPALGVTVQKFQITYGYGIEIDDTASSFIRGGSALGLGYEFGRNFHLQGYYNQIAKYYIAGMFRF